MACRPASTNSVSAAATWSWSHSRNVDLPLPGGPRMTPRG